MKFSTILTVLAIALCVTGCKYDKANKGAGAEGSGIEGQDISSEQSGSLSGATEGRFEDMYKRCTDVELSPVYFAFDSSIVPDGETHKADACIQHLQSHDDRVVVIEGNCDERGSREYNMSLGENRATVVRDYLLQNGITADRIQTRSYGSERPAAQGHDESAWAQNRRDDFAIYQK